MKAFIFTISFICIVYTQINAQVVGKAFLENDTDHSGIKVKFTSQSPTAVTDSTTTLADGSYSINLKGGVYLITFQKNDIEDSYNKGGVVLLQANQTLSDITVSNTVYVSGYQKGTWHKHKKYKIINHISISAHDSLIIEAGTEIEFQGEFSVNVEKNGLIKALGTETEKITFKSLDKNKLWKKITITDATGIFRHCIFEDFNSLEKMTGGAIEAKGSYTTDLLEVTNCEFKNFYYTAIFADIKFVIEHNSIHDYYIGYGIATLNATNSSIRCNHIYNATSFYNSESGGIYGLGAYNISENYIHDMENAGIECESDLPEIRNNVISNVEVGIKLSRRTSIRANGIIENNSILYCTDKALWFELFQLEANSVNSNLFYMNNTAIRGTETKNTSITNNLFFGSKTNFTNVSIPYIGDVVSVNDHGDPIDSYNNVYENPLFINPTTQTFLEDSPIYNAGFNGGNIGFNNSQSCINGYLAPYRRVSDTLSISGVVYRGGIAATAAIVTAIRKDTVGQYSATVGTNGSFTLDSLPAGNYILKATPNGNWYQDSQITFYPQTLDEKKAQIISLSEKINGKDIHFVQVVGIDETFFETWSASPNPFSEQLEVSATEPIQITDAVGKVVYSGIGPKTIYTSDWISGIYFLNNGQKVQKIVKY